MANTGRIHTHEIAVRFQFRNPLGGNSNPWQEFQRARLGRGRHPLPDQALFMDVRVWLAFVHTSIFAPSPGEKTQIVPFLKRSGARVLSRVLFRAGRPVCALQPG